MNLSVSSVLGVVRRGTRHSCAVRLCLMSLCLVLCAHGGRLGVARPRADCRVAARVRVGLGSGSWVSVIVSSVYFLLRSTIRFFAAQLHVKYDIHPVRSNAHKVRLTRCRHACPPCIICEPSLNRPAAPVDIVKAPRAAHVLHSLALSGTGGRRVGVGRPCLYSWHAARATRGAPHPTIPDPKPTRTNRIGPRRPLASSACAPHSVMGCAVCT